MSRSYRTSLVQLLAMSSVIACLACSPGDGAGTGPGPSLAAAPTSNNGNGALVEVGEFSVPFGIVVADAGHQLVLYFRWDNGFCGGVTPTDFVPLTYQDIIRVDETWQSLNKTADGWAYVYAWDGVTQINCSWLTNTTPLVTGHADRLSHDNDFYPFPPYSPGPGANAYVESYQGSVVTPAGTPAQLSGHVTLIVGSDGATLTVYDENVQLSPDPRN